MYECEGYIPFCFQTARGKSKAPGGNVSPHKLEKTATSWDHEVLHFQLPDPKKQAGLIKAL